MRNFDADDALGKIAENQRRIVTRAQVLGCGVTARALAWRLRTKSWQRLLPGIYALFAGRLAEEERFVAAVLHGGPGSQVSGSAALRWHGFRYVPADDRIQVNVPLSARRTTSTGFVRLLRTERPDRLSLPRQGFEVCSVVRAVADTARRSTSIGEVRALVAEAIQSKRTSVGELFDELDAGPMNGSAALRRVLREVSDGVRSRPEAELRNLLQQSKVLPTVLWNPTLTARDGRRLPRPDAWLEKGAIAIEVDSQEFHFGVAGWEETMRRDHLLAAAGIEVLHLSPARIRREPTKVLRLIEETYLARSHFKADIDVSSSAYSRRPRDR
jgi:hypothetical protein